MPELQRTKVPLGIIVVLLGCFSLFSDSRLGAQEANLQQAANHSKVLSETLRRVVFDSGAFFGPSTAMPARNQGYLISREIETFEAAAPNVRLYDATGKKVREVSIWFPGAQRVAIYAAVATSDGRVLASGFAQKTDGTASPFIASTDLAGQVTNVVQTAGFAPKTVCVAPDGTVWSFGGTGYDEYSHQPNPGDMLRHFDLVKGEVGSFIPRLKFPRRPAPESAAHINCSESGLVVYSAFAQVLIQMDYNATPHLYHLAAAPPSGLRLIGFAATGSREIFGFFSGTGKDGLYYLAFDQTAEAVRWLPVHGTVGAYNQSGVITGLWGSDGDNLVVSRAEDRVGRSSLHWVKPLQE